jgi:hypothetical protein
MVLFLDIGGSLRRRRKQLELMEMPDVAMDSCGNYSGSEKPGRLRSEAH